MAYLPARLHASTRRDEPLTCDTVTGEVRVPIALYDVDERCGTVALVLSRTEAQQLLTQLAEGLEATTPTPALRGLESVR